jgi:hypothetical protein
MCSLGYSKALTVDECNVFAGWQNYAYKYTYNERSHTPTTIFISGTHILITCINHQWNIGDQHHSASRARSQVKER